MTLPRVITEEFGGSPLAVAAQRGQLAQWYPERPRNVGEWRSYLRQVGERPSKDDWLRELMPAMAVRGHAATRLQRVHDASGVVVSSGQQAALFGGPLYTLVKALSALATADVLEHETGVPTVPVFWAATDDADYEEARWAAVATRDGARTLRLGDVEQAGIPMSDVQMRDVEALVEELAAACGSAVEPSALALVREWYTSGRTLGNAYVGHLRAVLEPLGIAVLDASHPGVRRAAAPVLSRALTEAAAIERALRQRYEAIRAAGFAPQVEHLPDLSLVFDRDATGAKRRVPVREATTVAARGDAATLGPNVLLRPIVERFIMPSAAYLGGPGELAYFAQVSAAADALKLPAPLALPRWSTTIVEPRIERLLSRLGVTREELQDRHSVEAILARAALPADVSDSLRRLRREVEAEVAALEVSDRDELVPPASLQGLRRSLLHRIDRTERRYLAAMKRRELQLMRDVAAAAGALYPNGERQERVLNFVPFLARYGAPLLDCMHDEAARYASALVHGATATLSAPVAERV